MQFKVCNSGMWQHFVFSHGRRSQIDSTTDKIDELVANTIVQRVDHFDDTNKDTWQQVHIATKNSLNMLIVPTKKFCK